MKFYTWLFIASMILIQQKIQAQGCDGTRYLTDIATSVSKETVQYGFNVTGAGVNQDLMMDIYTPDGDTRTDRPVIVYAFGGSFIGGSRGDVQDFCERYARRGYVTVGIDYRLYDPWTQGIPDSLGMLDEVVKAVADMKAAIRFLRKSAESGGNPYGIHPDMIYSGGISAGAITALHAAYITSNSTTIPSYITTIIDDNGGVEGDTDLPSDSHAGTSAEIGAVINMSGALHRANFLEEGGAPVVSVHGDNDDTVPYAYGYASALGIDLVSVEGSSLVHARAESLGIASDFYSVAGGGHVDFYGDANHFNAYETMIVNFIHNEVACPGIVPVKNLEDLSHQVQIFPSPAIDKTYITLSDIDLTYSVVIMDQLGKEIRTIQNNTGQIFTLERMNLPSGMYHVQIRFDDKEYAPVNKRVVFR